MADVIGSLSSYYGGNVNTSMVKKSAESSYTNSSMDAYGLDMSDFLSLMVAQFTNQSMDNSADINDMLNQLVQMQMVTALASMSTTMETMTDHSIMTYAASLVGKEVTVSGYDKDGNYSELVGEVTATGSYGGEQVIFIEDKMYYMTQIIAVGRLTSVNTGSGSSGDKSNTLIIEGSGVNPNPPNGPIGSESETESSEGDAVGDVTTPDSGEQN